jgi:integrase
VARIIGKLSAAFVSKTNQRGLYADGGGLYLHINDRSAKSWTFRFMLRGRAREMGLGPVHAVSLAAARQKAAQCRALRLQGVDPIEQRRTQSRIAELDAARSMTFDQCAKAYIKAHEAGWRHAKHHEQWKNSLERYVSPVFSSQPVGAVDVAMVMKVLEPIWTTKPETAVRVRGRIEAVLDWAKARGFRDGDNPARWRGHLSNLLPRRSKVRSVKHYAALPYAEIGAFMSDLQSREGVAATALEFLILTAARTSEVISARWSEVDWTARMWTIPASRMKGAREHRVPLSGAALAALDRMKVLHGEFIFPSELGCGLWKNGLLKQLKRMDRDDVTAHGFRSTFRDWAAECTNFPREVVEMALAHAVGDKVEAAYRRGDLFEKRRRLMADWAKYCTSAPSVGVVVPIKLGAT